MVLWRATSFRLVSRFQTLKWLLCPAWGSLSLSTPGRWGVGVFYLLCRQAWPWSTTNIFEPLSSQTNSWPSPELTQAKGRLCWLWSSNPMGQAFHLVNHVASSLADYSWLQKPSSSIAAGFSLSFRTVPSAKTIHPLHTCNSHLFLLVYNVYSLHCCFHPSHMCLLTSSSNSLTASVLSGHKEVESVPKAHSPPKSVPNHSKHGQWQKPATTSGISNTTNLCQTGQMNISPGAQFCSNLWKRVVVKFLKKVTYFPPCFTSFFPLFSTSQSKMV